MRTYEDVTIQPVPARVEKKLTAITCDVCKIKTSVDESSWDGINWARDSYTIDEVQIKRRDGTQYPEDSFSGKEVTFEICDTCFDQKVVPFLTSLGATPRVEEC